MKVGTRVAIEAFFYLLIMSLCLATFLGLVLAGIDRLTGREPFGRSFVGAFCVSVGVFWLTVLFCWLKEERRR
jgi:hypothetical protein